jgi:uncharacterized damage-inducible protein DinB
MAEIVRLLDQLTRSYSGPAWYGPAIHEALAGVTAEMATRRPCPGAHTIAELVLHCTAWETWVCRKLAGEDANVSDAESFPAHESLDATDWEDMLNALAASHKALRSVVSEIEGQHLDDVISAGGWNVHGLVIGVTQHHAYHTGQIMLIKKVLNQ